MSKRYQIKEINDSNFVNQPLFLQNREGEWQNTPFSVKMRILDFPHQYPFIREF